MIYLHKLFAAMFAAPHSHPRTVKGQTIKTDKHRLFACECVDRALANEFREGREPHPKSWVALDAARRYAKGLMSLDDLTRARARADTIRCEDVPSTIAAWHATRALLLTGESAKVTAEAVTWAARAIAFANSGNTERISREWREEHDKEQSWQKDRARELGLIRPEKSRAIPPQYDSWDDYVDRNL